MKKKYSARTLLALVILILAGALAVTVGRNLQRSLPDTTLDLQGGGADLSLRRIDFTETRDGVPHWILKADSATHAVGPGVTSIENVHLTFLDSVRGDVVLTARQGTLKVEAREVTLKDQVVVENPRQGYTLTTDRLAYREATRLIETDAAVTLRSQTGMELTGRGMKLNVDDMSLRLVADVKARVAARGGR